MRNMENSANTPTSANLEGQGRAVSMPKLNAEMQVLLTKCCQTRTNALGFSCFR